MKNVLLLSLLAGGISLMAVDAPPQSACPKSAESVTCPKVTTCPKEKSVTCSKVTTCPKQAVPAVATTAPATEKASVAANLENMGRGVVNLVTCSWEFPRCMLYWNARVPFWGFIQGAVNGVGCTTMRAFSGVTDILFLGFEPGTVFDENFRPYVWQSKWLPAEK